MASDDRQVDEPNDPRPKNPNYEVGYGRPPIASRFKKGQSGNPRGRQAFGDVGPKRSCYNTSDDQPNSACSGASPRLRKNVVAAATVTKNSAVLTEPMTIRGA
jgi:hypothetical protein